jgi:hypothetical protein
METQIRVSKRLAPRYKRWAKELLALFGPDISYGEGSKVCRCYHIKHPVNMVDILDDKDYNEMTDSHEKSDFIATGKAPIDPEYSRARGLGFSDLEPYRKLASTSMDMSLGNYRPIPLSQKTLWKAETTGNITLCVPAIRRESLELRFRVPEIAPREMERLTFRTCLLHELGHHYCFGNFCYEDIPSAETRDLFILEGYANWFANIMGTPDERLVLAELAIGQKPPYRIYQYLKHASVETLLDALFVSANYLESVRAFEHIVGSRHNMNGRSAIGSGKYHGVLVDWSGNGGGLLAGDFIKSTTCISDGFIITPRINVMAGRYPKNVLILTSTRTNPIDYRIKPKNMVIVEEQKLREAVRQSIDHTIQEVPGAVAQTVGLESYWIEALSDKSEAIDAWAKGLDEMIKGRT